MSLAPVIALTRLLLRPVPPSAWLGAPVSTLDLAAGLRLCVVLRQIREAGAAAHRARGAGAGKGREREREREAEETGLVKSVAVVLVVVYGGEAVMGPWLGVTPSFLLAPTIPLLYAGLTALVEALPRVPRMTLASELPLAPFDGLSRAFLVCQLIPPFVTRHARADVAQSPWTLVLSSLILANTGFFLVNLFSMLAPTGFAVATPPELRARGWRTADVWCAPLGTALFALLTHAQPFWAAAHAALGAWAARCVGVGVGVGLLSFVSRPDAGAGVDAPGGAGGGEGDKHGALGAQPLDPEVARAACAVFLAALFVCRTVKNFGGEYLRGWRGEKKRVMRNRVDGRRYNVGGKTKTH